MICLENVSYTYPHQETPAVENINLSVDRGEALLCTGGSGSGKSTLIRLINGLAPHHYKGHLKGRVTIKGRDTRELSMAEISEDVGTMFQDPEHQFFALKVEDELGFALECRGMDPKEIRRRVRDQAKNVGILHLTQSTIFNLSQGEKQKLALAGILTLEPRIIILDEPSANLDPAATRELARILKKLKDRGITLFIVDHRLYWLGELVDRVCVLDQGRVALGGDFGLLDDPAVRKRYGLRCVQIHGDRIPGDKIDIPHLNPCAGPRLQVENLEFCHKGRAPLFEKVSFSLPMGEVLAVTGENGVGKTTLARLLTGLLPPKNGSVCLDGAILAPRDLLRRGSIVLQNTDHQLHMGGVEEELLAAGRRFIARGEGGPSLGKKAAHALEVFGLGALKHRHPQSLSGGQKQRLVIAAALMKSPDILILDEPTSGLDGANMAIMAHVVSQLAAQGTCVLVITHDLELMEESCTGQLALPLNPIKMERKIN